MADINQSISLGIGSPSGIDFFLTFGLSTSAVVDADTWACTLYLDQARAYTTYIDQTESYTTYIEQSCSFDLER